MESKDPQDPIMKEVRAVCREGAGKVQKGLQVPSGGVRWAHREESYSELVRGCCSLSLFWLIGY